ncbi:MAG: EAL domain-containing protein, partial [Spirochaetaceae bacterium]|nr:EAL domain-containing protein [Spirochaetaceae bacterium]
LQYQPKIDTKSQRIYGVEALIRWELDGKLMRPDLFIPIAEETNLIIPLGRWIIEKAMSDIQQIHKSGHPEIKLSINLSTRQFNDENLFNTIAELVDQIGFEKSKLVFEITEGTSVKDIENSFTIIEKFNSLGYALSMDDFGTGYSSLSYLKKFALSELKIDKSFIQDIPQDQNDAVICQTIIRMAESLNYSVVAEGVETKEQLEFLEENGCHIIQGYFFSKPLSIDGLRSYIKDFGKN